MKFNFKKISAVVTGALLAGMTMGVAAVSATNFPGPFTTSPAIVYGVHAQPGTDSVEAANIQSYLSPLVSSGTTTVSNESYQFKRGSTLFHLGNGYLDVKPTALGPSELKKLLADGTYRDENNQEFDYTQKISMNNNSLSLFSDNDYNDSEPTVGIRIPNGANVLNYTLTFTDSPYWKDLATSTLPLMGKNYYVLSTGSNNNTITLLDSANSVLMSEGETKTVSVNGKSYNIKVDFIGDNQVKLTVNGESTNVLTESSSPYGLSDGSYVGVKNILYTSKTGASSQVEFSIGSGELKLTNNSEVELNSNTITGLSATLTNSSGKLSSITLVWNADDDLFVAEGHPVTMPGFKSVTLSYTGLNYPTTEKIMLENSGDSVIQLNNFPLKDSTEDIDLAYINQTSGNFSGLGKDSNNKLVVSTGNTLTFDGDTDSYFVASYDNSRDSESYLMRATNFKTENSVDKVTIQYKKDGSWTDVKTDGVNGESVTLGNVGFTLGSISRTNKVVTLDSSSYSGTSFNKVYSKEGMRVMLPWINTTALSIVSADNITGKYANDAAACANISNEFSTFGSYSLGYNGTVTYTISSNNLTNTTTCTYFPQTYNLYFAEEDKDGNVAGGTSFYATASGTVGTSPNYKVGVSSLSIGSGYEIGSTKEYENFINGALATETLFDEDPDQHTLEVLYHGSEVSAGVYIGATSGETSTPAGNMLFLDNETSSYGSMNLIVVGGSCINHAAATLLGVNYGTCGEAFTAKTGIGSGQYMIKGYNSTSLTTTKRALLVAGYNAADTKNGVTYLVNNGTSLDVDGSYKGRTTTEVTNLNQAA